MKEHPILYSAPMIVAKLEGRKTQTRRILKVQPEEGCYFEMKVLKDVIGNAVCLIDYNQGYKNPYVRCPYGNVGDVLWARETFCKDLDVEGGFLFKATNPEAECEDGDGSPWKPSIHMPKSIARIWERITDIRVERLQDISEYDAIAEGCVATSFGTWWQGYKKMSDGEMIHQEMMADEPPDWMIEPKPVNTKHLNKSAKDNFRMVWLRINGLDSWDQSPWVWVITTEILSTTGRPAGLAVSKTETK